uniref:Uncharacterized protein n=1 Tax=Sphaerodactylus townsendi TaxID=933632 RepID=A0ACB8E800_9SAUR
MDLITEFIEGIVITPLLLLLFLGGQVDTDLVPEVSEAFSHHTPSRSFIPPHLTSHPQRFLSPKQATLVTTDVLNKC